MRIRTARALAALMIAVALPVMQAAAQDEPSTFRLAQAAEAAGDYENAVRHYRRLHATDPANYVYFDGLRRVLLQLKDYDGARTLLVERLARDPADIGAMTMLGSVEAKAGREKEATAAWERAVAADPKNPAVYRVVAGAMMENRLLESTADLYRRARRATGDPRVFTLELAQILAASMEYEGATAEYVAWLRANPNQLSAVQTRMGAYTGKPEGRTAAEKVLRDALEEAEDPPVLELLVWVHLEGREFERAFEVQRRLDEVARGQGNLLLQFADRAYREGAYETAARAYREAIRVPVAAPRMPAARYGEARALTEAGNLADTSGAVRAFGVLSATESRPQIEGAIGRYQKIIDEYPRTEFAARSLYQIGMLQYRRLFDLDGALRSFEQVEREWPSLPALRYDVRLKTGEILVMKGDTARARERLAVVAVATDATPDQTDEAAFRLAELDYFAGRFPAAIGRLGELGTNLKADFANDAIGLLAFLQENSVTSEEALREFAAADLLARQRRAGEAVVRFRAVAERHAESPLADDALFRVGRLEAQTGRYEQALAAYRAASERLTQAGLPSDQAQFAVAEVYQFGLNDRTNAVKAYQELLADHPTSLLVPEARRRIRYLRGDAVP